MLIADRGPLLLEADLGNNTDGALMVEGLEGITINLHNGLAQHL